MIPINHIKDAELYNCSARSLGIYRTDAFGQVIGRLRDVIQRNRDPLTIETLNRYVAELVDGVETLTPLAYIPQDLQVVYIEFYRAFTQLLLNNGIALLTITTLHVVDMEGNILIVCL